MTNSIKATNIRWKVLFITLFLGYIAYVFRGNLSVIGISIITNLAAGMNETKLSHQETLENASLAENNVLNLIKQFISEVRLHDSTRNN